MTIRDTATGQRTTLLRVAAATWLLLVSAVVLVDHMALSGLAEQTQASAPVAQMAQLESRLDGLSDRLEQRQSQPAWPQARYEQDTAALDQRLAAIELAQAQYAATDALHALETRVTRLEARPVSRQPKLPAPRPSQPVAAQPKPVEPSFRLIGVELRAGEHFVSVMPADRTGLADVRLLRVGESEGGWRLDGIERDGAVFRRGDEIRRLPIPPR
ncbi:hypothetical protein [Pseudomonas aeruginosa]|uniref:hypothetical protein n=1 Tax=Pseudomonas aeruginosa TaxID=287 RepID=UPI00093675E7|nr:hypothetical protein [Pseudomonas aeruginosa]